MALTKEKKLKSLEDLKENISKQKSVVFVDFAKVNSKDLFDLRKKLKGVGCILKIGKKTLIRIAFGQSNISFWNKIKDSIPGQLALIFGMEDEISPARVSNQFSKTNKDLKILGGIFPAQGGSASGWGFIEKEKVLVLANLPSRNELLGKIVGSIASPISGFATVLQGNIKGLIVVLSKINKI